MKVVFIHRGGPTMASFRYRAQAPADAINAMGGTATVNGGQADAVIFAKPMRGDVEIAQSVKGKARVVVDICDPHFGEYAPILKLADRVTCPTPIMAERIKAETGWDAIVIPDPVTSHGMPPHVDENRLLWIGHPSNLGDLMDWLPELAGRRLRVVSSPNRLMHVIPWTADTAVSEWAVNDCVLLPTRVGAEYKSPNRLCEALHMGCFAICAPHPAYEAFKPFVHVGTLQEGLGILDSRDGLNDRVRAGQEYVRREFDPRRVATLWLQAIN